MNHKIWLCCFFIVLSLSLEAATDSTIYPITYKFNEYEFSNGIKPSYKDTSLDQLQGYKPFGNLGNNGLPINDYMINSTSDDAGFRYNVNYLKGYLANHRQLNYFNTRTPYTKLFFLIGVKKELMLDVVHSQNIKPNLNFALNFKRIRSEGFYNRQNTNDNVFTLSSNYRTLNNRYALLANLVLNDMQHAENGGIQNDSLFESAFLNNRLLMGVNLQSSQTRYRQRAAFLQQYLNLGTFVDSVKVNDSTYKQRITPSFALSHQISIDDNSWQYKDNSPLSDYATIYLDSTKTNDSTWYMRIQNQLSFLVLNKRSDGSYRAVTAEVGVKHESIKLWQNYSDTSLNNLTSFADVRYYSVKYGLGLSANMQYVFSGNNSGNYLLTLNASKNLGDSVFVVGAMRQEEKRSADWQTRYYVSNHFTWNNKFDDFSVSGTELYIASPKYKFKLSARLNSFTNTIFYDSLAMPAQMKESINAVGVYLQKHLSIAKIHFVTNTGYRYVPHHQVIRMPQLVSLNSLYVQGYLFKKAMFTQFGFDISFFSGYYSNAYMPATSQFYFQKNKKIGDYPVVDVFLNVKISSARIFIKYEHASSGLFGLNYYAAPGYPIPDRSLKLGINWTFGD